jgi:hypothetical protein
MSQIKVNSIVPVGGLPSGANGGIIQVVEHIKTDVTSTTGTSYSDISGMAASITPSSSSNKVLVVVTLGQLTGEDSISVALCTADGTSILQGDSVSGKNSVSTGGYSGGNSTGQGWYGVQGYTFSKLHSPATTSAVTYKLRWFVNTATGYLNRTVYDASQYGFRTASTITLYEVTT